ncbi:MAG: TetR/AcrR family transcriptional regulator [Spirochaetia bacterium]|nr:TetR/AcrR family transcriptional regulator [Spirochaetia bacterium]
MKSEERKLQIIQETLAIIGESGLQGLTVSKIASNAGITEAALYRHFKNKEDILLQVVEFIGIRLTTTLNSVKDKMMKSLDKLSEIFFIHTEHIQKNHGIPRIIYTSEVHVNEKLRVALYKIIDTYLAIVGFIIEAGIKNNELQPDINATAESMRFLAMIQFTAFRYSLSGFQKKTIMESQFIWNSYANSIKLETNLSS